MIKTIFFDFDGVLTLDKSGSYTTCQYIQKAAPHIPFDDVLRCYRNHHRELLIGQLHHRDIWDDFCACLGIRIEIGILDRAFRTTPQNAQVIRLCHALHKDYQLGIITDNSKDRFDAVKDAFALTRIFDYFIVSADTGARKASAINFIEALATANVTAAECGFIDNDPTNLVVSANLGFRTIFHDDEKNDVALLARNLEAVGVVFDQV